MEDKSKNGLHVILGASDQPGRASYIAAQMYQDAGYEWIPLGRRKGNIFGKNILPLDEKTTFENVDTVTLYMNPTVQEEYIDYILSLHPRRIIFNPGTENVALLNRCKQEGIETVVACTLVLLSLKQY